MAKSNETNAKADRARLDKVLSAVPQPNRATRRKIEAQGDAVSVDVASLQDELPSPPKPPLAAAAHAPERDRPVVPQSVVVQSDISTGESSIDGVAEAASPEISAKRASGSHKVAAAAKSLPAEPLSDVAAPSPSPSPAEIDASAIELSAPASSSEPALSVNSAQPTAATSQTILPVFSIKDMTMDMSTNFTGLQTAMTEAQAKAKAAFEKSQTAMGEVSEFTKGNVEAIVESSKIFAEGCQEIGSTLAAESRTAFEAMTGDIKELAAAKSPTDFLKIQSDMLRKSFDSAVAYSSKNSETFLKLMSDAAAPLSGRVSLAVEKARQTATVTPATV
jgi:hypothetical protein